MSIDFAGLAANLLARSDSLLPEWLPGGKLRGTEYVCGNLRGDPGDSLSVNVKTGVWADFATDEKGGDLIDLYAAIHRMTKGDVAKALGASPAPPARLNGHGPAKSQETALERPPEDAGEPPPHPKHGKPVALYAYRDGEGLVGYIARYEPASGKEFSPWRWQGGKWSAKAFPKPRPLYGTERLLERPDARVLVVEGEKCADAALTLLPGMVPVTWAGGAQAADTADWSVLAGRKVGLWPDNDEPSRKAFSGLAAKLHKIGCEVHTIVPTGQPEKWDVADALAEGWTPQQTVEWIKREGGKFLQPLQPVSAPAAPVKAAPAAKTPSVIPPDAGPLVAGSALPERIRDSHSSQLWMMLGLDTTGQGGVPACNEDTVDRVLRNMAGDFWYDEFLQRPMTSIGGQDRMLRDSDFPKMAVWFQRELRLPKMKVSTVKQGIEQYMFDHTRNCAREWMNSLQWDGEERLNSLLPRGWGTEDNEYYRKVGRNFIMQMVHRVMEPGCKADYMPIFEGGQGRFKSTALRVIGNEWFTECHEEIGKKDFYQILPGKMLVEIAELSSFSKSQIEAVKGVITNPTDTYRASYGRLAGDYPRQCVFAGTTNRDDWNQDDTGARRFWRVLCGNIDIEWLKEHRDQLIAEAVKYVKEGEEHYIVPEGEAKRLQNEARTQDLWHESVMRYCNAKKKVRIEDIATTALGIDTERQDKRVADRIRSILKIEGWVSQAMRIDGATVRGYRPPSVADTPGVIFDQTAEF